MKICKLLAKALGLPSWFIGGTIVSLDDMLVAKKGRHCQVYDKECVWLNYKPDVTLDSGQKKTK